MPPKFCVDKKKALLEVIKDKKNILFGKFTTIIEKRGKEKAWEDVLVKAQSLQLVTSNRSWQYVRDNLFGVWKSRALEKKDNAHQTGRGGGKRKQLDESEELILEIIGKDSPTMEGLDIEESMSERVQSSSSSTAVEESDEEHGSWNDSREGSSSTQPPKKKTKFTSNSEVIFDLKCKEKEAKISLINSHNYKTQLEVLKLERDLGLPRSDITRGIVD